MKRRMMDTTYIFRFLSERYLRAGILLFRSRISTDMIISSKNFCPEGYTVIRAALTGLEGVRIARGG